LFNSVPQLLVGGRGRHTTFFGALPNWLSWIAFFLSRPVMSATPKSEVHCEAIAPFLMLVDEVIANARLCTMVTTSAAPPAPPRRNLRLAASRFSSVV
jgi:hypothetical protein